MSKKNSFGKILAFTTAVAAIGGACYIFRDQIKESAIYKKVSGKLNDLRDKVNDKFQNDEDDFFFDDDFDEDFSEEIFNNSSKKEREYTSITINAKEEKEASPIQEEKSNTSEEDLYEDTDDNSAEDQDKDFDDDDSSADDTVVQPISPIENSSEDVKEVFADATIPTITFNTKTNAASDNNVSGYENEGLSDVYEDPDVLSDMDQLDI